MVYNDWYEKYVKPKYKVDNLDIWKIERANNQYEKYKSILGDKAPKSLEDYIDLKYNDKEGYEQLKDRAKWIKAEFPTKKSISGHFKDHGNEFDAKIAEDYQRKAAELLSEPKTDIVLGYDTTTRRVRYDKKTGAIAIGKINPAGGVKITTMFKPDNGEEYYHEDYEREHHHD